MVHWIYIYIRIMINWGYWIFLAISHDSYCFRVNIGTLEISRSNNCRIKSNASTNTWVVLEAKALAYRENAAGIRFQEFQSLSHARLKKKEKKRKRNRSQTHRSFLSVPFISRYLVPALRSMSRVRQVRQKCSRNPTRIHVLRDPVIILGHRV